ncbi:MAG: YraN family protein, partial [Candidatus Gastranaerophilales bacterium]|nr:YraN family protein [Candidatus Gastranaerophilales bacterium]
QAFGHPIEAISPQKLRTIQKLAEMYMMNNNIKKYERFRIDVVGILTGNPATITHITDVF